MRDDAVILNNCEMVEWCLLYESLRFKSRLVLFTNLCIEQYGAMEYGNSLNCGNFHFDTDFYVYALPSIAWPDYAGQFEDRGIFNTAHMMLIGHHRG